MVKPRSKKVERVLSALQHAVTSIQFLVVVIYWGLLFPSLGWAFPENTSRAFWVFLMIFQHTIPFICKIDSAPLTISNGAQNSYSSWIINSRVIFLKEGTNLAVAIFGGYIEFYLNIVHLFDIIPYLTPLTDGKSKNKMNLTLFFRFC